MGYTLVQQQRLLAYPMGAADYQTDTRLSFLNVSKVQTELGAKAGLAELETGEIISSPAFYISKMMIVFVID